MIDAVLSYHTNPNTCGVAKFNQQLAQRLGVPLQSVFCETECGYPLLSVKREECHEGYEWTTGIADRCDHFRRFDVFWHGEPDRWVTQKATRVFAANARIADQIREYRPDVIEAFCPATIAGNPHRAPLNILTFGMAHKLQTEKYEKLKALLGDRDYTISLSTAVHEGSPWSAVAEAGDQLRAIFGDKTRVLGYLLDDALAKELQDCSAVALFFDPALRANNTTFWAAAEAGKPVIFNADDLSPCRSVLEIDALEEWPDHLVGFHPDVVATHSWDALLQTMGVSVSV
jgi:hypothetical protein